MKRYIQITFIAITICMSAQAQWFPWMRSPEDFAEIGMKEKQTLVDQLKKERDQLNIAKKPFMEELKKRALDAERRLVSVRELLRQSSENDFLLKEQSLLNDWVQVIKEEQKGHDAIIGRIEERIALLEEYLKDPALDNFRRELTAETKTVSFEFVQELNKKIVEQERSIKAIEEQQKNVALELENRRRLILTMHEAHNKRKEELENLRSTNNTQESLGMNLRQRGELSVLEEKKYKDQTALEELRLKELEHKQELLKIKLFLSGYKLDILKEVFGKAKLSMRMSEAEIVYLKDDLAKKKVQVDARADVYQKEIDRYVVREDELKELSSRLNIPLNGELADWAREPKKTIDAYMRQYEVATLNEQLSLTKRMRDLLEARKLQEQENFEAEKLQVESKETFSMMGKFASEAAITDEIKNYLAKRAKLETSKVQFKSIIDDLNPLVANRKKALENIKERERNLVEQRDRLFKTNMREYGILIKRLHDNEELIRRQIKFLDETQDAYEAMIAKIHESMQLIDFVVAELNANKLWYRPEQAIAWQDLSNVGPDMHRFFQEVRTYVGRMNVGYTLATLRAGFAVPISQLFRFLLILFAIIAVLIGAKWFAPEFNQKIIAASQSYRGLRTISVLFSLLSGYYCTYFIAIASWILLYTVLRSFSFTDPCFYLFFYLFSIPYFLYLSNRFVHYLAQFNEQRGYAVISQEFQKRFMVVLSILLYSTTVIVLFRESFFIVDYVHSNLPTLLLALNVIILQISIIFLFNKDSFQRMIPTHSGFGEWVYKQVDSYYYLIVAALVAIIVLVNPYIGYGRLLLYVVTRVAYTIGIVYLLFWLHDIIKRMSTGLFFQAKDDTVRERFTYAKTWYGMFVITSLLTMIAISIVIIAKFWDWPHGLANIMHWEDAKSWLTAPFIFKHTDYEISFYSFFKLIFFFLGGLIGSFAFDRFVLDRIFDVLFVEPGVQHAVSSITRYFIVFIAIIAGFHTLGLGSHIWYVILAAGAGLGFVIKDPLFDFISYFIILIQRPVKVGDYIRFDDDIRGVVRRITPRTVVLRRRNSTTIVVPNSQIMGKPFSNWNYSRGFTAFDDIYLTIEYSEDPAKVREVILNAVRSNQYILKSPSPIVRLYRFGAYGYVFSIRGFLSTNYTLDMWDIASDVRLAVAKALREQNIKVSGIKPPDMLAGMTTSLPTGVPAEFREHRTTDE